MVLCVTPPVKAHAPLDRPSAPTLLWESASHGLWVTVSSALGVWNCVWTVMSRGVVGMTSQGGIGKAPTCWHSGHSVPQHDNAGRRWGGGTGQACSLLTQPGVMRNVLVSAQSLNHPLCILWSLVLSALTGSPPWVPHAACTVSMSPYSTLPDLSVLLPAPSPPVPPPTARA